MQTPEKPHIGFTSRQRWITGVLAILGAFFVAFSVAMHARIHSRVSTIAINQKQPVKVLVGIRGTSTNPAFIGFLAVVKPNSQILTVVPISGTTEVRGPNGKIAPLYTETSQASPIALTQMVSQSIHVPIHHYFYFTTNDLLQVMNALYYHTNNHWPKGLTPSAMLGTFGYPDGAASPKGQVELLSEIVNKLPDVNPLVGGELLGMAKTSRTNLTAYQVFSLANYIRGDALRLGTIQQLQYHPARRTHG
ncbi:MAG: hypothetical protein M1294_07175 [Firmicutes bacterium]|jgi:hypothetical protein|uniref:Uncharacterized protein n=1 Tax=Sulfobacillus benefaciens TaxID=453960 RepID=A0A2T2X3L8_9FIRM|nr:hypothetical protein [Bacillota bacterium]MCL5015929.1 hypothetical protein [Bacillota bacterium]PSR29090.1 MAG: hypothetical protein C7B43_08755 [Sulfobacillus benefaciens]HBQ95127.1 hypothetical protein [Sulfobacillus sp.]